MSTPFDAPPKFDPLTSVSESANHCGLEVWGPPTLEKSDPQPIEPKSLLQGPAAKIDKAEAEFLKSFSPKQLDEMFSQVRRTFDKMGLDSTKATPENIKTVSRNLVAALGSNEYSEREFASRVLRDLGIVALPTLVDCSLTSPDIEQQKRVNRLIQPFSIGSGQQVAEERQRLDTCSAERRAFGNRIVPFETDLKMQMQITGSPDAKIDDNLGRLEKLLAASKEAHIRSDRKELVGTQAGKLEREIDEIKATASENAKERSRIRVSLASGLIFRDFDPEKVSKATKDTAALLLSEALKEPRLLASEPWDYQVRRVIADLKYFKHPSVPRLEAAYRSAGGDPKILAGTAHSFANRKKD